MPTDIWYFRAVDNCGWINMAELVKKIHIKTSAGIEQTAKIYTTTAEVGEHWMHANIDGVTAYVAIGDTADGRATSGMVKGSGGDTYAILSSGKLPYNKVEYRTPGTYTFTSPATTLRVTIAGGGGGGGAGRREAGDNTDYYYTGGNGGRGGLVTKTISVTEGQTVSVIVGAGGAGGIKGTGSYDVGTSGTAGGTSSILGVSAVGGGGGNRATTSWDGYAGASYGNGGTGGNGGRGNASGSAGSPGWIIIEYGGDI